MSSAQPSADAQVRNAVGFLSHPKVKPSSAQDKVNFLVKKGLSKQQIAQAFQSLDPNSQEASDVLAGKYDNNASATASNVTITPLPAPIQIPSQIAQQKQAGLLSWKIASGAIALLALGGASAYALQKYVLDGNLGPQKKGIDEEELVHWRKQTEELNEDMRRELRSVTESLKEITESLKEQVNVQKALNTVIKNMNKMESEKSQASAALQKEEAEKKSEIVFVEEKQEPISIEHPESVSPKATSTPSDAGNVKVRTPQDEETIRDLLSACRNSINNVIERNSNSESTKALATIKMFLQKIIRNPDDLKLRKIPFSNKIFIERIKSVNGAENVLEAIGFSQAADSWNLALQDQNKSVDLDLLKEYNQVIEAELAAQAKSS